MAHPREYSIGLAYIKYIIKENHTGGIFIENNSTKIILLLASFPLNDFLCSKHIPDCLET